MTAPDLDNLLAGLAQRPAPELPGNFTQDVLREIRLRGDRTGQTVPWFAALLQGWLRPAQLGFALALAMTVGVAAPFVLEANDTLAVTDGLGLRIFSASTSQAPSGLLARIP